MIADFTQARFGDKSPETLAIHGVLDKFKNGNITKRETLSTICDTLGDCNDLKHDLLEVLNHQDARWGPGDFDLPFPAEQQIPQFLQPVHEPQMRLPSISTLWSSSNQALPSLIPALQGGLDNYHDSAQPGAHEHIFEPTDHDHWHVAGLTTFSPSVAPEQYGTAASIHHTSESIDHAVSRPQWQAFGHDMAIDPSCLGSGNMPQEEYYLPVWDDMDYSPGWDDIGPGQFYEQPQGLFDGTQPIAAPESIEAQYAETILSERRSESVVPADPTQARLEHDTNVPPKTTVQSDPHVGLVDDIAAEMPPPTRKRSRKASIAHSKPTEQVPQSSNQDGNASDSEEPALEHGSDPVEAVAKPSRKQSEGGGHYIHGICGKAFASRSKVKKHHWGSKMDDTNTTTGCWFKHKKPSVSWNDHPSCRETQKLTPPKSYKARSTSAETKAPVVPAMVPSDRSSGLPALQSRAGIGADHVNPTPTPQAPKHDAHDTFLPYHSHSIPRNPSNSSFESLLTAVNFAAKIEEPKAKARNDSVIFNRLEAHALEAERTGRYQPGSHLAPDHPNDDVARSQQHIHASTSNGLGTYCSADTRYAQMHDANPSHPGFQDHTFLQETPVPGSRHGNLFSPKYTIDQGPRTLGANASPPQHQAVSSSPPPRPSKKRSKTRTKMAMVANHNSKQIEE
jgi:hypothetical protein